MIVNEQAATNLRNAIVFAMADGELSDAEKTFIDDLREKLGVSRDQFAELCDQVREDPKKFVVPDDDMEAYEMVRLMAEIAVADGEVSSSERRLLGRLADHVGIGPGRLDSMLNAGPEASPEQLRELERVVRDIYANFAHWDAGRRRSELSKLTAAGSPGTVLLLRIFESYRTPDAADNALELKTMVCEQLGQVADARAAYYLAQQVSIGDGEDETTSPALRAAAAEAMGKVVGESFSPDADGVRAARLWWQGPKAESFEKLAM